MNIQSSGIYKITNSINNKFYIGSAKNLERRWKGHKAALAKNIHGNEHLQKSYNIHGESIFVFTVIIYCNKRDLLFFEQRFLNVYWDGGINCYNISKSSSAPMNGLKHTEKTKQLISNVHKGKKKSEETRKKMSLAQTGHKLSEEGKKKISIANSGSNSYRYGKPIPEQNRLALRESNRGEKHYKSKLTEQQVIEIYTSKEPGVILAKKYNVPTSTISKIRHGTTWKQVTGNIKEVNDGSSKS